MRKWHSAPLPFVVNVVQNHKYESSHSKVAQTQTNKYFLQGVCFSRDSCKEFTFFQGKQKKCVFPTLNDRLKRSKKSSYGAVFLFFNFHIPYSLFLKIFKAIRLLVHLKIYLEAKKVLIFTYIILKCGQNKLKCRYQVP